MEKFSTILDENRMKSEEENQDFTSMCAKIDQFLILTESENTGDLPDPPTTAIDSLTTFIEKEMANPSKNHEVSLFDAIEKLSKLMKNMVEVSRSPTTTRALASLRHATTSLKENFCSLLEDMNMYTIEEVKSSCSLARHGRTRDHEIDLVVAEKLRRIASTMIAAGHETECCHVFSITRREKINTFIIQGGFFKQKFSIEELDKLQWEELQFEIDAWIITFRRIVCLSLFKEQLLCDAIFSSYPTVSASLFTNLTAEVIRPLLNFVEVVTMTKKNGERLYKFLEMYEFVRDLIPDINELLWFARKKVKEDVYQFSLLQAEIKSEVSGAKYKIGEVIVEMFNFENLSRNKSTNPDAFIHPVTSDVVNCLDFVLRRTNSMIQVFQEHYGLENTNDRDDIRSSARTEHQSSPFAARLRSIMELLDDTIYTNSRLCKDQSLGCIFLMKNANYTLTVLKRHSDIEELLGDQWDRKMSIVIQQNQEAYKRDSWQKVIHCLREEGLRVKGTSGNCVYEHVLKERIKSFNLIFEEIVKRQSHWYIFDMELKLQLRASVQAMVVPAYRSFVERYGQNLEPESLKYIKYTTEELETYINDLFWGGRSSIEKRM